MAKIYDEDTIEIPRDHGRSFLGILEILSQHHYSGPFGDGKDSYRFNTTDNRNNFILVNPIEGVMTFFYTSPEGKKENETKFLSIKRTIEIKF